MNKFVFAALALLALTATADAAATRLATEGAYPPYNFVDDNGNVGGFDVDLGNELCKRAGLECTWVVNEWDTLIPNLIAGNYDAILADMTITAERKKTIDFTRNYFPPDPSTYISLATSTIDYDKMTGLKIGTQSGTIQAGWANLHLKDGNTLLSFTAADQAIADLNAGNIDVYLAESSFIDETVAGSNGTLKADGPAIAIGEGAGIGLRQGDAELKDKFETALAAVKADGWLDALIARYFPELKGGPFFTN